MGRQLFQSAEHTVTHARWRRLPAMKTSLAMSFGTLVTFVCWIYWDPVFDDVLDTFDEANYRHWLSWDGWLSDYLLGVRLVAFACLSLFGVGSTLFAIAGFSLGRREDRSLRSLFLFVVAIALWLLLLTRYDDLDWLAFRGRIRRAMPLFKKDAVMLLATPSTTDGTLQTGGAYELDESLSANGSRCLWIVEPEQLLPTRPNRYKLVECVTQSADGQLSFALLCSERICGMCWLKYRPDDSPPPLPSPDHRSERCIRLEQRWFLVYWAADTVK